MERRFWLSDTVSGAPDAAASVRLRVQGGTSQLWRAPFSETDIDAMEEWCVQAGPTAAIRLDFLDGAGGYIPGGKRVPRDAGAGGDEAPEVVPGNVSSPEAAPSSGAAPRDEMPVRRVIDARPIEVAPSPMPMGPRPLGALLGEAAQVVLGREGGANVPTEVIALAVAREGLALASRAMDATAEAHHVVRDAFLGQQITVRAMATEQTRTVQALRDERAGTEDRTASLFGMALSAVEAQGTAHARAEIAEVKAASGREPTAAEEIVPILAEARQMVATFRDTDPLVRALAALAKGDDGPMLTLYRTAPPAEQARLAGLVGGLAGKLAPTG